MRGNEVIPGKPNKSSKKKQLNTLFDMLKEDYLDKYNNITRLGLYPGYIDNFYNNCLVDNTIGSNNILIEALYPLKKLESLIISSELINDSMFCSKLFLKLQLSLKTLYIIDCRLISSNPSFYPVENINEEYSNLKRISVISNKMLSNMTTKIISLTDVTIFSDQDFCRNNLTKFIFLNLQLEKLSTPVYFLGCRLVNSILQMNQLKQFSIKPSCHGCCDILYSIPVNTSIEQLNISCHIESDILLAILNNLKSLKVLEFSDFSFYKFKDIDLSIYEGRIPLLHLNSLWYAKNAIFSFNNIDIFDNTRLFSRIRFTNMFELDYYLTNYEGDGFDNLDVCNLDSTNSEEFTLINLYQK